MSQWLLDFEEEFARHYDTPDEFLNGIGLMVAGAALANRVYVMSPGEVTTNTYLILVSPPGWFHKSSPVRTAVKMLKKLLPKGEFVPSNASTESLGKLISLAMNGSAKGHGIMIYDEFRNYLQHIRKEYAANIGTLVTERFEEGIDLQFARKKEGKVDVDVVPGGYILSFVASTTTTMFLENMKSSDVTGGMLSRFLIVEAHEKTRSEALPKPLDQAKLDVLTKDLENVRNAYAGTQFYFDPAAMHLYKAIYHDIERGAMSHGHPEYPSLISRAPTYVKKLALIHAALAMRSTSIIETDDIEFAAETVISSIKSCELMIDEAVAGDGAYARNLFRIRKMLIAKEKMQKRDLLRAMHVRIKELDEVLESLAEQGHVKFEKDGKADIIVWVK